ncbi:DUF1254 domain-containing protein [Hyphococcus luteus]|uniref:DUF1254 domain-containing protein n=1 Tax=Hyphococcus luteus TaxID=2058213 RepID=A0A2S7K1L4_9PROT|nr:DUF1254 domain-containing protein [Marinicaulis flavus]PQA86386.1 hypothetical protein CW354_18825 [Marinicaulis flavus]
MKPVQIVIILAVFLTALVATHLYTVRAFPRTEMDKVIERVGRDGERVNTLVHAQPITNASRNVVRPSPDLIYSICVYDLSDGPVYLEMTLNEYYSSLSIFDNDTNNFFVVNDREIENGPGRVFLVEDGDDVSDLDPAAIKATSPTRKGVALIRRLAGSPEMLKAAQAARQHDVCRPA